MDVVVYPGAKNPTHEVSLSDGQRTYGLRLEGGASAIQEIPQTPSTINISGGGSKFGDWEPGYAHIEQRDWSGGRGLDDFSLDNTRYYDGQMAYTLVEGKLFPAPQWRFAQGLRTVQEHLPGSVRWQPLAASTRCFKQEIAAGQALSVEKGYFWLRRVGNPGTLTARLLPPLAAIASPDQIAALEEEDLDEFDSTTGSDLTVSASAALSGSFGMQVDLADTSARHGNFTAPADETAVTVDFLFDPNSLSMADEDEFALVTARGGGAVAETFSILLKFLGGKYLLRVEAAEDSGSRALGYVEIADAPIRITTTWQKSTGADDGALALYLDGVFMAELIDLDNDTNYDVDEIRFGAPLGADSGTSGAFYMDDMGWKSGVVTPSQASTTVTTQEIDDFISVFHSFDFSGVSLGESDSFVLVISGDASDRYGNHWEIGVDAGAPGAQAGSACADWEAAGASLYYRLVEAETNRRFRFFELAGALYAVDVYADGSNSSLLMNGERGKATAGSTATTLVDSDEGLSGAWSDGQWNGWRIRIVKGTGAGQHRLITDTDAASAKLTVDKTWDITPSTDSEYVIYGGDAWQELSGVTLGAVKDVAVVNDIAYLAQGSAANMKRMRFNAGGSPPAMEAADDSTNKADLLLVFHDDTDGLQIWRAKNDTVDLASAAAQTWPTDLTFGTAIDIGGDSYPITNLIGYDDAVWAIKPDGLYKIVNDKAKRQSAGLDFVRSPDNGRAAAAHRLFLYFSWGNYSLQRFFGDDLSPVGPDEDAGLPDGRQGPIAALASHPLGLFAAVDAGESGVSSVLIREDARHGWHEVFRAWEAGRRVGSLHWQDNPGARPRLWIGVGGEIVYQEWPANTLNPLHDTGLAFQHECVLTVADIDMGAARLPKFIKELGLASKNPGSGAEIHLDYQVDEAIGGDVWLAAGSTAQSPEGALAVNRGDVRSIRCRLRMLTEEATSPPVVRGAVLEGFARTPVKYQWNLRVKLHDSQHTLSGVPDHDPDELTNFLKDAARRARRIHMRSLWEQMDDVFVVVEPPSLFRRFSNRVLNFWGGTHTLILREA